MPFISRTPTSNLWSSASDLVLKPIFKMLKVGVQFNSVANFQILKILHPMFYKPTSLQFKSAFKSNLVSTFEGLRAK